MTDTEIAEESAAIDLQMKRLNLELMREQLQTMNEKKEARRLKLEQQQRDLEENERQKTMREAACKHRKGGRNKEGLDKGSSPNYAVIQNTYPAGEVQVMCQRCGKTWDNPSLALKRTHPEQYARLLVAYRAALEWPTDNEPSGTQLFLITRRPPTDQLGDATQKAPRVRNRKRDAAA